MGDIKLSIILWGAGGVASSVLLPFLATKVRGDFPRSEAPGIPPWLRPYVLLTVFSLVAATVCIIWWLDQHPNEALTSQRAFLVGFAWETITEKLTLPPNTGAPPLTGARRVAGTLVLLLLAVAGLGWALIGA